MTPRFDVIHACVSDEEWVRDRISRVAGASGRRVEHVPAHRLEEELDSIEVLLCAEPPRIDWSRATRLRLLQLMGSGIETLWPATGLPAAVEVANARGIHLPEMRDHALALMLAFERRLFALAEAQRERRWSPAAAGSLAGKTVAVLGLGEVGRSLAAACAALGMRVVGVRAEPRPTPSVERVYGPEDLEQALRAADYVIVLVPLTEGTRGLLDARALGVLRPSAVLIHLSRGGVVDEAALCAALREGRLAGAALDVLEREPLPPESPLWIAPRLVITPHVAGRLRGYLERALALLLENVERVERGAAAKTRVDRERRY
jgi:phosphoglycerate dehydrogenase-like enzyme